MKTSRVESVHTMGSDFWAPLGTSPKTAKISVSARALIGCYPLALVFWKRSLDRRFLFQPRPLSEHRGDIPARFGGKQSATGHLIKLTNPRTIDYTLNSPLTSIISRERKLPIPKPTVEVAQVTRG